MPAVTRAQAAQKAAYWAGEAERLDAEATRIAENAPSPRPSAISYASQLEEAAIAQKQVTALEKRRDDVQRMAGMWTATAEALKDDGVQEVLRIVGEWVYAYPNSAPADAREIEQLLEQAGHHVPGPEDQ